MRPFVSRSQARQLLHNKFVVVLGGSVQRSMYKDLVLLLQRDQYLTLSQLKSKGEFSYERDSLVEGGRSGPMTNGTEYREVRQYRSDHHLLRFYFLTRIYSPYVESVLEDFRHGLKPDVIIVSSCAWDITRYGQGCLEQYKENLRKFFGQITAAVCHDCLVLWCLAMPLGKRIKGGFLVPEVSHLGPTLRYDIIEANFYSGRLAEAHGVDVLDLHFHFRLSLQHRMPDGVHWDALAHRHISSLLLRHAAGAWGVDLRDPPSPPRQVPQGYREDFGHHRIRPEWPRPRPLLDSEPLQRCGKVQYQQSRFFQVVPPNSAVDLPRHYPQQLHLCRQPNSAAVGVRRSCSLPPVQRPPPPPPPPPLPPPAAGNWTLHRPCGGFGFRPRFQANGRHMRRWRSNFRTHPYPPRLPLLPPRRPPYGCGKTQCCSSLHPPQTLNPIIRTEGLTAAKSNAPLSSSNALISRLRPSATHRCPAFTLRTAQSARQRLTQKCGTV